MPKSLRPRRAALRLLGPLALVVMAATGGGLADAAPGVVAQTGGVRFGTAQKFFSAPSLRPAAVRITQPARGTAPGYVFTAPRPDKQAAGGPMIFDNRGHLAWFHPLRKGWQAITVSVTRYKGRTVVAWGARPESSHVGSFFELFDTSYRHVAYVRAGHGDTTDLHDFRVTPQGTAYLLTFNYVPYDLSSLGGSSHGQVLNNSIQVVDIASGRVLWRWSALGHIPVSESVAHVPQNEAYDAYHFNSISLDKHGDVLVSARHTSTLYKISRHTGKILWRLGGKRSNFKVAKSARFAFQHDARWGPHSTITMFDNGTTGTTKVFGQSSGRVLRVHPGTHTVTSVRRFVHRPGISAESQGTFEPLADGHAFIGWGHDPVASEFDAGGNLVWEARFPSGHQQAYSARRYRWTGTPTTRPAVAGSRKKGVVTVQVSWNGATEVRRWQVLAGSTRKNLKPVGDAPRRGFETMLRVRTSKHWVAVRALGAGRRVLRTSAALKPH